MSWRKITVTGDAPAAREGHGMAELDGHVYVSCGTSGRAAYADLWVLSATGPSSAQWAQLPSPPGDARWGCSLSCVGRRLYLFGGDTSLGMVGLLLMFDIDSNTWSEPAQTGTAPVPRANHTATVGAGTDIIIFGGKISTAAEVNDIVMLHTPTMEWYTTPSTGDKPAPRKRHSTVLFNDSHLLTFSGWQGRPNNTANYRNDLCALNMETMEWTLVAQKGAIPEARGGHVAGIYKNRMFLWGGWGNGRVMYNELHYLDLDDFSWLKQKRGVFPPETYNHTGVMIGAELWVWGGCRGGDTYTDELWVLDVSGLY